MDAYSSTRRRAPGTEGRSRKSLPPGTWLNATYKLDEELGHGGFGIVYRAQHRDLGDVAIKEYMPGQLAVRDGLTVAPESSKSQGDFDDGLKRFLLEARHLSRFRNHSGIVSCRDFFRANGTAYLVMDFEDGVPLSEVLAEREARDNPFRQVDLLQVMVPLLQGLAQIHADDVLHRDIKPSNILLRREDGQPVLIDFGAAKQDHLRHTRSLAPFTPGYAAFEQVTEDSTVGPWTDIYAAGALMWRMVAGGNRPFEPPNPVRVETRVKARLANKPDPLPSAMELGRGRFSAGILAAIDECLALKEAGRIQTCDELLALLTAPRGGQSGPARPGGRNRPPWQSGGRGIPSPFGPRAGRGKKVWRERCYRDHGFVGFEEAVVVDVDTTGLDPDQDRIVAVSLLKANFKSDGSGDRSRQYEPLKARFNPGVPIPAEATAVHGIRDLDVRGEPTFAKRAEEVRKFVGDLPLIGHNVSFDKAFLSAEFRRAGVAALDLNRSFCTMGRMRELQGYCEGGWRNSSLDQTAKTLGVGGRSGLDRRKDEDAQIVFRVARRFYRFDHGNLDFDLRELFKGQASESAAN